MESNNFIDQIDENTIILEPQETFNKGIIGYNLKKKKLIYSSSLLIKALMIDKEWKYVEAVEWIYFNTIQFCNYNNGPIIIEDD